MSAAVSLSRQISAWNAEILLRRKELELEVRRGRMSVSARDFVIESLEAGVDTLRALHEAKRAELGQAS